MIPLFYVPNSVLIVRHLHDGLYAFATMFTDDYKEITSMNRELWPKDKNKIKLDLGITPNQLIKDSIGIVIMYSDSCGYFVGRQVKSIRHLSSHVSGLEYFHPANDKSMSILVTDCTGKPNTNDKIRMFVDLNNADTKAYNYLKEFLYRYNT